MQLSIDQIIGYLHLLLFIFVLVNMLVSIAINKITKLKLSQTIFHYWFSVLGVFFLGALFHSIELLSHLILSLAAIPFYFLLKIVEDKISHKFPIKWLLLPHFIIGCSLTTLFYSNNLPPSITAIPVIIGGVFILLWAGIVTLKTRDNKKPSLLQRLLGIFLIIGSLVHSTYPLSLINSTMSIAGWTLAFFSYQFSSPILFALILENIFKNEKIKLIEMMNAFERFVPKKLLYLLEKDNIESVDLGDNISEKMAILFVKIHSFSELASQLSPEETLNLLNISYSAIEPIIYKHNGFVDNLHDGTLTAIFPKSSLDSINAAVEMKNALKPLNHNLNLDGFKSIDVGIGIDYGKSIIGTTGSKNRMQGTVISTSINMAEELAKLSETYQSTILITSDALISFDKSDQHQFEFVDNKYLKGRSTPVTIYEVTGTMN